ncbi:hypothetical protein EJ419_02605 [Alloscardovia theropitheci]|uniref:Uncharacterized protein n=1 Tax=Alloscardovia theropitheci TaxID=2496842 RepID=A0A4R0QYD6_9BIFI|nr:DUF5719 family protein [Alloscardovia theropitheci]TCD54611.1 hypothetical protein EJ419_02605 [Alloscardovia theropitheci]
MSDKEHNMDDKKSAHNSLGRKVLTVTGATVSALVLVAGSFYLGSGLAFPRQRVGNEQLSATSVHDVAQLSSTFYCPARMDLADSESYGDSDFQASTGNLTSTSRISIMGSLYQANMQGVGNQDQPTSLLSDSAMNDDSVRSTSTDGTASSIIHTRTLSAKAFTGASGTVASWASDADLRGISASSCVSFATSQSFLVPATSTGWSQQLIVANASDKPTSITLTAYGSQSNQEIALETHATATINAHSESIIDLGAAFKSDDPTYVVVDSDSAPVAAVVRAVHMSGLTPQGSEYIQPLNATRAQQVIPALSGVQSAQFALFAHDGGTAKFTFLGNNGEISSQSLQYQANQVSVTRMNIPQDCESVLIDATSEFSASAYTTVSGNDGQSDFAMNQSQSAHSAYAVNALDGVNSRIDISNLATSARSAQVVGFAADGSRVGQRDISISAHGVYSFSATDISDRAATIQISQSGDNQSDSLVVGQSLSVDTLASAQVAQRAVLTTPSVELFTTQYTVTRQKTILN